MVKLFNHYFHRRTLLQMALDMALVTAVFMAILLTMADTASDDGALIVRGLARGLLMGVGFLTVNAALGFYDRSNAFSTTQMWARALVSFLVTGLIVVGVLLLLPLCVLARSLFGAPWIIVVRRDRKIVGEEGVRGWAATNARIGQITAAIGSGPAPRR